MLKLIFVTLLGLSFYASSNQEVDIDIQLSFSCGQTDVANSLRTQHFVFIDNIQGFYAFLERRVRPEFIDLVKQASELTLEKFESNNSSVEFPIESATMFFREVLRKKLIALNNIENSDELTCEMQIAGVMEALHDNKVYAVHNREFTRFFSHHRISSRFTDDPNKLSWLIFYSSNFYSDSEMRGHCKLYEQKGAKSTGLIEFCN